MKLIGPYETKECNNVAHDGVFLHDCSSQECTLTRPKLSDVLSAKCVSLDNVKKSSSKMAVAALLKYAADRKMPIEGKYFKVP